MVETVGRRGTAQPEPRNATGASSFDRLAARDAWRRGHALLEAVAALRTAWAVREREAETLYRQAHEAAVVIRLRDMPVQELRSAGHRVRLAPSIERAGYRTVLDVLHTPLTELVRLQGVGNHSAATLRQAAEHLRRIVRQDTAIRLHADRKDPALDPLLRALRALRVVTRLQGNADAGSFPADLADALRRAKPATRRGRLLFARAATKAAARAAADEVGRLLGSGAAEAAVALLAEWDRSMARVHAVGHGELWADFARDAAAYNTFLERVSGRTADGAAAPRSSSPGVAGSGSADRPESKQAAGDAARLSSLRRPVRACAAAVHSR